MTNADTRHQTAWAELLKRKRASAASAVALFQADPSRFEKYALERDGLFLDLSKNPIDDAGWTALLQLADASDLETWRQKMFSGAKINATENRAVLHTALRNPAGVPLVIDGKDIRPAIRDVLAQMRAFTVAVRGGIWKGATGEPVTDVVNIGIGGSDLGPAMAVQALKPFHKDTMRFHFVSNVDGVAIKDVLAVINPKTTLFIIASKTFTTAETLTNAKVARDWLVAALGDDAVAKHCVAVSTNKEAVSAFGIDTANMFPFWDWVGGRYSVWSAIGLSLAIAIGMAGFDDFLAGALAMDDHFQRQPLDQNMPVLLALAGIWNKDVLGAAAHAVLPYADRLGRFPAFLQQLDMESNGKAVGHDGGALRHGSGGVIFGEPGTNAQHAFMQLVHQGSTLVSSDFIGVIAPEAGVSTAQHRKLLANCLAQGEALMVGKDYASVRAELADQGMQGAVANHLAPHKIFPGSRPVTTILLNQLDPKCLGMLIALYEHKVFVQSVIYGINAFDQWGVELGKTLAGTILNDLEDEEVSHHDPSTAALIARVKSIGGAA